MDRWAKWQTLIAFLGIITAVTTAIATIAVPYISKHLNPPAPVFTPNKPIINPRNEALILEASNNSAKNTGPLDIEFNRLLYAKAGKLKKDSEPYTWIIQFQSFLNESMLTNDDHKIRVRFPGRKFSEPLIIRFFTDTSVLTDKDKSHGDMVTEAKSLKSEQGPARPKGDPNPTETPAPTVILSLKNDQESSEYGSLPTLRPIPKPYKQRTKVGS